MIGVIAGGPSALTSAVEGAEDKPELAIEDLKGIGLTDGDVVVGIATSGRTPYVLGSLEYAQSVGAFAVGLCCNRDAEIATRCDLNIAPVVGAEVVSGSTRMKAGTATKLVLNMITTGAMIRLGKTFGNLMVDMRATNEKLKDRSERILMEVCDVDRAGARDLIQRSGGIVKTATISFGQPMPDDAMAAARAATLNADLFLSLGSSLQVFPAANFPIIAEAERIPLVIINREATGLDNIADLVIHDDIGDVMSAVMARLALH